jgi:hypothetical protein
MNLSQATEDQDKRIQSNYFSILFRPTNPHVLFLLVMLDSVGTYSTVLF